MEKFDRAVDRTAYHSTKWCSPAIKFSTEKEKEAAARAIPLWIADMDFPTEPHVIEALEHEIQHGIYGYTGRWDSMFAAFMDWIERRHGWKLKREWLDMSPGVLSAVCTSIQAYTRPGDKIILQTPIYTPFFELIEKNGRQVLENPLLFDGEKYSMDFDDLEKKAADSRASMMILCSPHNPVGRVWTKEELLRMGEICMKNNLIVFSDEIHSDLILSGHKHIPFAMLREDFAENTITSYAPSKTFNLAGLFTSMVVAPGLYNRRKFASQMRMNGANAITTPGKVALEAAYNNGDAYVAELMAYIEGNLNYMIAFTQEHLPGVRIIRPEGTYMAWMDFRNCGIPIDEINSFLLCEAGVVLEYGDWFGGDSRGFERINLACNRSLLEKAMKQIQIALDKALNR